MPILALIFHFDVCQTLQVDDEQRVVPHPRVQNMDDHKQTLAGMLAPQALNSLDNMLLLEDIDEQMPH